MTKEEAQLHTVTTDAGGNTVTAVLPLTKLKEQQHRKQAAQCHHKGAVSECGDEDLFCLLNLAQSDLKTLHRPGESQQLTIIVEHSQINVAAGGDALFSVRPSSSVSSGSWSFKGKTIAQWVSQTEILDNEYRSRAELFTSNGSLLLKSVNVLDSGEYRVNMVPNSGSQPSATVTLRVTGCSHLSVPDVSSVFKAIKYCPTGHYLLMDVTNLIGSVTARLTLNFVSLLGMKECNRVQTTAELVSNVTVTSNATMLIEYSDTVSLTCFATGTDVSYLWLEENSTITPGGRFELSADHSTLTVSGVLRTDGRFTCRASNLINEITSPPFNPDFYYGPDRPFLIAQPDSSLHIAGSTVTLKCFTQSHPVADLYWQLNGVHRQSGQPLILDDISVSDTGNYTCKAYNRLTGRYNASTMQINVLGCSHLSVPDVSSVFKAIK
ncbi:pregnancy-specific beta-1-glycoprotein 1-like [Hemitrygon akajei]|uniref:pregnancy-specific beta-1-glycoprotein 1-like n=1 Tax=Hemitrygon akajei TaxID=2704970 RepID=UPI003BFA2F7B